MALNYVTLTGQVPGGAGGVATFTPSGWLTDSNDNLLIPPKAQEATLDGTGKFSVVLLATDNGAPLPSGWSWSVVISGIYDVPSLGFSFPLPFSGGATQDLSDLAPVQPPSTTTAYLPLPSGSPVAGEVPVVQTNGSPLTAWQAQSGGGGGGGINPPAGDLGGNASVPTVVATHLSSPLPVNQGGTGNTTGDPSGAASGDLSGTYPAPTVAKLQGTTLAAPPGGTTEFLRGDGTWAVPPGTGGGGINPPAGDIGGTTGSPTVVSTHLSSALPVAQGGTGQATQQAAINALTGAQTSARYLRSDGTNATLAAIQAADVPTLNQSTTGTAAGLSATLAVASGGTGQTTQQAAIDALAGATTSGDYLRGNGTHVVMSAIQVADVPQLTNYAPTGLTGATASTVYGGGTTSGHPLSGTWSLGQWVMDQTGQIWVCIAGGTPGTWCRQGQKPWQFYVADYGAKGDGRVVSDGSMSSSVNPTFLTSATANFVSGDVGKNIVVNGALGATNAPLYATISSVSSSTVAVLSASATNSVTNAAVFLASDDSAAIMSAISAASTWAQANTWKAQVIFDDKFYGLATLTTTTAGGSLAQQNALVPLPYPNVNGTTQKLNIELVGLGESADEQYFGSTVPSVTGTALFATVAASGTTPSIIGGPSASTNLTGTWANVKPIIRGISVWAGFNSGWIGFDLHQCSACWVDNAAAQAFAPNGGGQNPGLGSIPTNSSGWGIIFPSNNDNGAGRFMVEGFYQGVGLSPRTTIEKLFTNANNTAVLARTVNATVVHGARIGYWSCQSATTALGSVGTSGTMPIVIDHFDGATPITTDLSDAHGTIAGSMNWFNTGVTSPVVAAGFAMKIVNMRLNPGPMSSPPTPPATTVASTPIFRDTQVTLSLSGGTLTALLIDAVDQHIPAGCVLWTFTVPSGHTFTPTYTGTLSNDVTVL